ncbi:MAG: hypothetical protein AAB588_03135 [Patescibacteria group bacterium]
MITPKHITETQRTTLQNRALHLYFTLLADAMNEAGIELKEALPEIDIPLDGELVKNAIWRPVQRAQLNKISTTKLTTKEIDKVYDTLNRYLGEKYGLHVPFPNIDELNSHP